MIKIIRSQVPPDIDIYTKIITRGRGRGLTKAVHEYNSSVNYHTSLTNYSNNVRLTKEKFSFSLYKDKELVRELGKIFGNKCAYCESCFGAVTTKDIEHFRPKSEIETNDAEILRPGYYWLATEWLNLLVSCPDCNRKRGHRVPGQPTIVKLGKHIQFPIANENARLRIHTCNAAQIADEESQRLLINPCIEDPEEYFTYDDNGLIHPKNANDSKAICSIYVYALQRKGLVEARKDTLVALQRRLFHLSMPIRELVGIAPEEVNRRQLKQNQIAELMDDVLMMFEPGKPYLGLLRDFIRRHIELGTYRDYISAGINIGDLLMLPISHRSLAQPLVPEYVRPTRISIRTGLRMISP